MIGQDHIALNKGRVELNEEISIHFSIFTSATHLHILLVRQLSKISALAHTMQGVEPSATSAALSFRLLLNTPHLQTDTSIS